MVIRVQVYGLVVAFDCLVELAKLYLSEGSIVVEEIIWRTRFQGKVVRDDCLFILF